MKQFFIALTPALPSDPQTPQTQSAVNSPMWRQLWRWCCQVALVQPSLSHYLEPLIRLARPSFRAHLSQAQLVGWQVQGGFIHLTLKPGLRWRGFMPGQHLQLVLEIAGRAVSRTFSISSSLQQYQQDGLISLTIQQQRHGLLTGRLVQLLAQAPANQPLHVQSDAAFTAARPAVPLYLSAASGSFVLQQQQPLLMLAAGSGITPIHAMLCSITRLTQPLLLIYSYRGADQLLFADSWQRLQQRYPLLQVQLIDTSSRSRLQADELAKTFELLSQSLVYLCGPIAFSRYWQQQLVAMGVSPTSIQQESFGLPTLQGMQRFAADESNTAGEPTEGLVPLSAEPFAITVQSAAQSHSLQSAAGSLLQTLEAAGLNPRYGCRRGICMQCLCQKKQGVVQNILTGESSDAGPGMIQLCISQPLSAVTLTLS